MTCYKRENREGAANSDASQRGLYDLQRRYAAHLRGIGVYGGARIYPSLQDTDSNLRLDPRTARLLNTRWTPDTTDTSPKVSPRH